jgi:predicted permease
MRRVLRLPFSRRRLTRDVDDELAFHFDTRIDQLVARGLTLEAARAEALKQFGDIESVRQGMLSLSEEREAAARRATVLSDVRQDLTYGVRTLRRGAAFTGLVVGGLALGIGANATIFSLIDAMLLRHLPVTRPEELVAIGDRENVGSSGFGTPTAALFSYPLYRDVRDNNQVFSGVLATGGASRLDVRLERGTAEPEHPNGRFVSGNYFSVLGVRAAVGTTLDSSDDVPGALPRATISHGYWTRRFQGDSTVIGRTITVNGAGVLITGVGPPAFTGEVVGSTTDIWLPILTRDLLRPNEPILDNRHAIWLLLLGRAKPGLSLEQVKQGLIPVIESSIRSNATSRDIVALNTRGLTYHVSSGERGLSSVRAAFAAPLVALMIGVALLLCIVCVNVANLLLARGIARRREMSLRLAIGANRSRIVRQLLTEGLLLALVSGTAAVLVGWWGSKAMLALASEGNPVSLALGPSAPVLAFTFALSLGSVVVFGLVPALRSSRVDLASALRAQSRAVAQGARFGVWLIAGQVAVSLVLVAGASMLTRSLRAIQSTELGLDRDHLIVADLDITTPGYSAERLATAVHALRDRVMEVPGVIDVTYSENGLFTGTDWSTSLAVPGFTPRTPEDSVASQDLVGAGYARAIGARVIAGRDLAARDEGVLPRVMMVNESFARFYFGGRDPVGRFVHFDDSVHVQIVGVVADIRSQSLEAPEARRARRLYIPFLHAKDPGNFGQPDNLRLLVRTSGDPAALLQRVRREIVAVDAALTLDDIRPLSALVRVSIRQERLVARIATALGVLALLLAGIGLYGVTTYTIARRRNEIGVRLALGARGADIGRMVLRDVLRPVVLGLVVGLPLAIVAMRLLQQHLIDASPDAGSVAIAIAVLVASAAIAGAAPAVQASRIDPLAALRAD